MREQTRYSPELREHAVQMVHDRRRTTGRRRGSASYVADLLGISRKTLHNWMTYSNAAANRGLAAGAAHPATERNGQIAALERENVELREANDRLKATFVLLARELTS